MASWQGGQLLARRQVSQANQVILGPGPGQRLAVGGDSDEGDDSGMTLRGRTRRPSRRGVPQPQDCVLARRGDQLAIGREGDADDIVTPAGVFRGVREAFLARFHVKNGATWLFPGPLRRAVGRRERS